MKEVYVIVSLYQMGHVCSFNTEKCDNEFSLIVADIELNSTQFQARVKSILHSTLFYFEDISTSLSTDNPLAAD